MNKQIKNLNTMIEEVETCNTYFNNHVSLHDNDYIRKVFIVLVIIGTLGLLLV